MKIHKLAIALTIINLAIMVILFAKMRPAEAQQQPQKNTSILRGTGLEITDSLGKVRASIKIEPPSTVGGKLYPQTVILRLIDSEGGPLVKLGAAENGGGMSLSDKSEGYIQLIAQDGDDYHIRLKKPDGKEYVIRP